MGTDLTQIGNHKIKFRQRNFKELANELAGKLNQIKFVNAEYLRLFALHWENSEPRRVRSIRAIKTTQEWTYHEEDPEYYLFAKDKYIEFEGPFGLSLIFYEHQIYFFNPPVRYWRWIEGDSETDFAFRNEWRKYMYQIVHAFGGNRVIYLADNSHPLDGFADMDVPFEEIEAALKQKFGEPVTTFKELDAKPRDSYMIDYLQDINWNYQISLEGYYPEPDDLTSIDYNLQDFATKEQLEGINWNEDTLQHKAAGEGIQFFHIARFQGVLVMHKGIVGGEEKIQTMLDKYAPFTFDEWEEQMKLEGYGNQLKNSYTINFYQSKHRWAWQKAIGEFEEKLLWTGNGELGGGSSGPNGSTQWFYAVNEKIALDLLISIGEKYEIREPIEIVRDGKNKKGTIILKR